MSLRSTCHTICLSLFMTACAGPALADHANAGFGEGSAGPIHTAAATPLPRGANVATVREEFVKVDRFSDAQLEAFGNQGIAADSTDSLSATYISGAHGVTDDLTVGARIPYIVRDDIREPETDGGMVEVGNEGDAEGIGDLIIFGQYRFWHRPEQDLELAVIGGLKIPTGNANDRTREDGRFEVEHQPGSGSWDPLAGLAATKRWGRFSLHGSVLYTFTTEGAQDTELGDLFNFNLAAVYRLGGARATEPDLPDDHGPDETADHTHAPGPEHRASLDVMLELNGEWQEKIEIDGARDSNSGGTLLYLSPGARLNLSPRWSVFGSVGIPVAQDVNGKNHETDYRITGGVSLAF